MTTIVTLIRWSLFLTNPGSITAKFRKMLHRSSSAFWKKTNWICTRIKHLFVHNLYLYTIIKAIKHCLFFKDFNHLHHFRLKNNRMTVTTTFIFDIMQNLHLIFEDIKLWTAKITYYNIIIGIIPEISLQQTFQIKVQHG